VVFDRPHEVEHFTKLQLSYLNAHSREGDNPGSGPSMVQTD